MPLKLTVPIEKSYNLVKSDAKYGQEGDPPTYVRFRQVTNAQKEEMEDLIEPIREWNEDGMILKQTSSSNRIVRKLVFLTLVDCNITMPNGAQLFTFENGKLRSEIEFLAAWGMPPSDVCDEIAERAFEANPLMPVQEAEKKQ